MKIPTLTTARLELRPFVVGDAAAMHRLLSGRDVLRYFPQTTPPARDSVRRMIQQILAHWQEHGYGLWAVTGRPPAEATGGGDPLGRGDLLGRCGLQYLPQTDEVEVDFLLGRPFWGQGIATEAGQASLRYGFEELGLARVVGIVHPENVASQRVLAKLGLRFETEANYFGMACYRYEIVIGNW